jgi:hypothetical protein
MTQNSEALDELLDRARVRIEDARLALKEAYTALGTDVAENLPSYLSLYQPDEAIDAVLPSLDTPLGERDRGATLNWFEQHLPNLLGDIPADSRSDFMTGVHAAFERRLLGSETPVRPWPPKS